MSLLGDRLARLTPDQRALFERMLHEKQASVAAQRSGVAPIERRPPGERPRLSFAQERLWLLDQLAPGVALHVVGLRYRLEGPLDAASLGRAFVELVRRHEALRTTFDVADGVPVPVVRPAPADVLSLVDLGARPPAEREVEAARLAAEEIRRPFDLQRELPLRAALLRLGDAAHVLLITAHHVAFDGWSAGILAREISTLYGAFVRGGASPLAELPIQYADFAAWQRGRLAGDALEGDLAYWRERLAGAPPALELPTDRPRPALPSHRRGEARLALPRALGAALEALGRAEDATVFMVLLAAYQILLARCSGQPSIVVGTAVAGRGRTELEGLVGIFINSLALRADLSDDPTFRALLRRTRDAVVSAFAHQELPFGKLVETLNPERRVASSPIFQTMLVLQTGEASALTLEDVRATALPADYGATDFDLSLSVAPGPDGLVATMDYRADLFDAATVERLLGHLRTLLEGLVADPTRRTSELPLLTARERRALLVTWNETAAAYPHEACVQELFEAQANETPGATALAWGEETLTYRALNERANRLAHHLISLGAGPGALVGICVDRSPGMVIALLGVLKAGAAYVPLDPTYPEERLSFILGDAGILLLITEPRRVPGLPAHGARLVVLDPDEGAPTGERVDDPVGRATSADRAYVIYTSGSTGKPKGVEIPHRALVSFLGSMRRRPGLTAADRLLAVTSFSFDIAGLELLLPLVTGAVVEIADRATAADGPALRGRLARSRITVMQATPSTWRLLVDAGWTGGEAFKILVGGEAVPRDLAGQLAARSGSAWNMYGPTETTIWSCLQPLHATDGPVLIGRPIANTRAYVLDRHLEPLPLGVPGELYLGGVGVARGYLGRPELTAERFLPDPFDTTGGGRLYRTGDLCRLRADGALEILGRVDHQVKLRGHRIELGEIEAALAAHPAVGNVVVALREDTPGDPRLVAYLVARDASAPPAASALRLHLGKTLPDYMVPSAFVTLDAIPLLPNGKIDRRALPAPAAARPGEPRGWAAPRTPVEEVLAGIWGDVLRLDRVGVEDDFFALGGHSLLGARVLSRLRAALGVELGLRALFEAPTVAGMARRVDAVRRSGAPRLPSSPPPVLPGPRGGALPLSYAQQRLWLLDRLEPDSATYNIPLAVRLDGALDARALERSLAEIVHRHEALRATFAELDGEPRQTIPPEPPFALRIVDLASLPEAAREAQALATQEARRPFDLARGPLLRATLLRLGPRTHVLVLAMHHIASDGWSLDVLARELGALYEAHAAGRPSPLPALSLQYVDHARWQRAWLSDGVLDAQLAYWKGALRGAPAALDLPADRARPAVQSYRGATSPLRVPRELSAALGALSRREGVTLFMTLLAAFQVLLQRHSGERDVVVGSPIAGRARLETEGLIGLFVNTLVLRTSLDGDPTFRELLGRVGETTLGAYDHQDVPFERLVEELAPARDLGRSPLFQAMLVLQHARDVDRPPLALGDLSVSPLEVSTGTAKFDLTLWLEETPQGLAGALEYATDLFEAATIDRLGGRFVVLLRGLVADPGRRISDLAILTDDERRLVTETWNATAAPYPRGACVHELFEAQAARTPAAAALLFEGRETTYGELDARANRLAHHLGRLGVGPESLVGVSVRRSPELIVAVLGALKAGAAWVPLDPDYPRDRLELMIADAEISVLLTQASVAASLPVPPLRAGGAAAIVRLDADWPAIATERADGPASSVTAVSAAYVIYTSGSTGRPKGVVVTHRGLGNVAAVQQRLLGVGPGARVLQFSSSSFDASVWDLVMALLNGATLVLAPQDALLPGPALLRTLAESRVSIMTVPPSALAALPHAELVDLETIVVAGEACPPHLVDRWAPGRRFWNAYGPTEASICASMVECFAGGGTPSIGRPIANVRGYVLDDHGQPSPIGVSGELYLGGVGLARGYLRRPELTAARLVPDPFDPGGGGRLYRTGDLCRFRADGALEILGRLDHQVKLRGYRIELGEIEAALAEHPSVQRAVVTLREDAPGDPRLVAYLVATDASAPPAASALRAHLGEALPDYMVPAAFVALDAIPLLPNGKTDRRALPAPAAWRPGEPEGWVAPRTPVEEVLAGIWGDVLRLDRVGVEDDFFALGGHSLLGAQVISRLRTALGVELGLRALFEAPTVAGMAVRVDAVRGGARLPAPPILPVARDRPLPLSLMQQRLWLLDRLEPDSATYNIPLAVRLDGALDVPALERSLAEIVRRHEALRTTIVTIDAEPRQVITAAPELPLPVVDLEDLPETAREDAARRRAAEEATRPFDLGRGPLVRASLLRLSARSHVLLWTVHHIVFDGWSSGVLTRELEALYEAFSAGRPSPLPALPIQYADYACWQRERLAGGALDAQLAYWKEQLRGAPAALDLPTDRPRPAAQSYRGAVAPVRLPRALSERLSSLGRREGATLFMTLLAAFQALLHRCSGQDDIVVGSPIAGRTRLETEGLIGFFVNTLVLRTSLGGEPTFRALLGRVREVTLGAYAHQDVPFERLVEELTPARDTSRSPLFQAMLVLENAADQALSLGGLSARWLGIDRGTSKFDVTLALRETADGLDGALEYPTDLFDAATMERMASHLGVLLEGAATDPGRRVSELPLLAEAERRRLVSTWNDTAAPFPRETCVHELFEAQADETPAATALVFEGRALSYRELDARADRLAQRLIALGAGPGTLVGLALERSPSQVVALLGILKAGGAYVPLDPSHPRDRLAFVIEDAELGLLVTDDRLARALPEHAARIVLVDDAATLPAARPGRRARAGDPAYAIYTSGSTGRPKGVLGSHRSAVNRFAWMWTAHPFQPGEVCCHKTTLGFVDAVWEIFGPLLRGVPAVLLPDALVKDVPAFVRALAERHVTRLVLVPSLLRAMLDLHADLGSRLPRLTHWTSSGEALPVDLYERFTRALPGRVLLNLYGSSEVAADSTCFAAGSGAATGRVPIGRPIANTQVYVLDARQQPVPIGVRGELHVGGEGVALGYLRRPELTAERFVPDPFSGAVGARLFRTGDLCRHRADGDLEHLGRLDHQVKLRGYRIELGEIEAALAGHADVARAVVVTREDTPGDPRLVAYVVALGAPPLPPEPSALRGWLRTRLPDYMVPAAFVTLEALPLLPSGKIDRLALPAPVAARRAAGAFAGPRNELEAALVAVWEELLPAGPIGIDDDFFALGGHSLLAVRLFDRIEKRLGKSLPVATLFQAPTIARLAQLVAGEGWAPSWSSLVPIQTTGSRPPFFCVHAIGGNVLNYRLLSRHLGEDQPFYGLQSRGLGGGQAPHARVEDMAAAYLAELRSVQPRGPYAIGGSSSGGVIAFEMAQQLHAQGERVELLVMMDTNVVGAGPPRLAEALQASALHRLGMPIDYHLGHLLLRSPRAGLAYVVARLRARLDGTANLALQAVREAPPAVRHVVEINLRALMAYTPRAYPGAAVMLLSRDEPDRVFYDRRLAWAELVEGGLTVRFMPGSHETMLLEPQVAGVAAALARCLAGRG